METLESLIGHLVQADPAVLVAVVCVVALLVVAECVKHLCKALGKKGDD